MRLIPCFLLISSLTMAQDSLVRFKDLDYRSPVERQAFRSWFKEKNQTALLDLFLSTDPDPTTIRGNAVERINQIANRLAPEVTSKKKPEKYVKTVYDEVHSNFLKKYELINRFPEIFQNGNYNCVTATALYALIFEKLNIPYAIQEKPTHVFLIAYPNQNNILVETTAPVFGYLTFDNRYKQSFIDNLKTQKLIGNAEVETMDTEELFNKYFFQNEKINLPQLVGIHYMNDALYYADKQDLTMALKQTDKAYMFYPSQRVTYMMMSFVVQSLATQRPKPLDRAALIGRAAQFSKQGITSEMIKGEFAMLTETVLTRDNNKTLYQQCFQTIVGAITDPELKNDIAYYYYFEIGRQYYNKGSYSVAKNYFGKALEYQPNNAELGAIFLTALNNSMRNDTESRPIVDTLEYYQKRVPTLKENNNFQSMLAKSYLMGFEESMREGLAAQGENYQARFEALYAANKDLDVPKSGIGAAYSAASSYYFKKGQKSKARAILDRGLQYAPGDYELRRRKQMIN